MEAAQKSVEKRQKAKESFERSISAKLNLPLAKWNLQTLVTDARLAGAGANFVKLTTVHVSTSGSDDLILLDRMSNQIQIVSQTKNDENKTATAIIALDSETAPRAILPMRLNSDALSDLLILREGSNIPSVVMTPPANTIIVTTTDDSGGGSCDGSAPCSLRQAITLANNQTNISRISFNVGGGSLQTIHPLTPLPAIKRAGLVIDATTQPGFNGTPLIEIKGDNLTESAEGLKVYGNNVVIRGFVINEMPSTFADDTHNTQIAGSGITLVSLIGQTRADNNIIEGNYLGLDPTGGFRKSNDATGISIYDSDRNTIGGTVAAARNIMSGNGNPLEGKRGVGLAITAGNENKIEGNLIGTDSTGTFKIGNSYGVFLTGKNNLIGGDEAGQGNTISGNGDNGANNHCFGVGISEQILLDTTGVTLLTFGNYFRGNNIVTDVGGAFGVGNCTTGIRVSNNTQPIIGSITEPGRNVISANNYDAIWAGGTFDNTYDPGSIAIIGNNIGTDRAGLVALPNTGENGCVGFCLITDTVWVFPSDGAFAVIGSPAGTTDGGDCAGMCNLISGNDNQSVDNGGIEKSGLGSILIVNNYIGTNKRGRASLPNYNGIVTFYGNTQIGGVFGDGNGGFISGTNIISGNKGSAAIVGDGFISTQPISFTFRIEGNLIGTSSDGLSAIPNDTTPDDNVLGAGIVSAVRDISIFLIGGTHPLARNIIAGNTANGIRTTFIGATLIRNNYIGINKAGEPLGNGRNGIIAEGSNTIIGGSGENEGNYIRNNTLNGVLVNSYQGAATSGNQVWGNSIANNGKLGIDLTNTYNATTGLTDGVTENDCDDADTGANGLQNYPEMVAPVFNGNGTVSVSGFLKSAASNQYTIQFYTSISADGTNYGEGENYLGSLPVRTDSNGFISFTYTSTAPVSAAQKITATATDFLGNTSEFSCFAGGCTNATFAEVIASASSAVCERQPIIVNVENDKPDNNRDGICDVDTEQPGLQCSLRGAIQEANARPGIDKILFNIPGGGFRTISIVGQELPAITESVTINGESQPGWTPGDDPKIIIDNSSNIAGASGLQINASPTGIIALKIINFDNAGIKITGGSFNTIRECFIGELLHAAPMLYGIQIENSNNNFIGFNEGNRLLGNRNGVLIRNSTGNSISNNLIEGNDNGIALVNSSATKIGEFGPNHLDRNTMNGIYISNVNPPQAGNFKSFFRQTYGKITNDLRETEAQLAKTAARLKEQRDVEILGDEPFQFSPSAPTSAVNTVIYGNTIGEEINAQYGIYIGAAQNTQIGTGSSPLVVSRNISAGIYLSELSSQTTINTAYVGTDMTGESRLENRDGIVILSNGNTVKNSVVSGNTGYGISIGSGSVSANGNKLQSNYIGTDLNGLNIIANDTGIYLNGSGNSIGDGQSVNSNVIGGNTNDGIFFKNGATGNNILKNYIGISRYGRKIQNKNGIFLRGQRNKIKANFIAGNTEAGIRVEGDSQTLKTRESARFNTEDQNEIRDNLIGTKTNGEEALANSKGIVLTNGATDNLIIGNTISGNTEGIRLGALEPNMPGASFNLVMKNQIGTDQNGTQAVANIDGIVINEGGTDNTIAADNRRNLISGNTHSGIFIAKLFDLEDPRQPLDNKIQQNLIGGSLSNIPVIPNGVGIWLGTGTRRTTIGGTVENDGNTIIGNTEDGIRIDAEAILGEAFPTGENKIFGNYIGLKSTGNQVAVTGNGRHGIFIQNSDNNEIGSVNGFERSFGNIIGLNYGDGIRIEGIEPEGTPRSLKKTKLNTIFRNDIGLNHNDAPAGNHLFGIRIKNAVATQMLENRIVNNGFAGIRVDDLTIPSKRSTSTAARPLGETLPNIISGNQIGVFKNSQGLTQAGANGQDGIQIDHTSDVLIGKQDENSTTEPPNIIAGNNGDDIRLLNTAFTTIRNSLIGTDENERADLGNGLTGILQTDQSYGTTIGGINFASHNVIAHNNGNGIRIDETSGNNNLLGFNSIFENTGLGIDIGNGGQNPNDADDVDEGVNRGQNYPELVSFAIDGNGDLIVNYKVDTAPGNANYGSNGLFVEFYKADRLGEGKSFLGSDFYTVSNHDSLTAGTKQFNLGNAAAMNFTPADKLTSLVRDEDGNSSEFTPVVFAPTAVRVTVGGKVTDTNGNAIALAIISLIDGSGAVQRVKTNSFGFYRFENVEVGQNYVIQAEHKKYQFVQPSIILEVNDAVENADFTARK